MDKEMCKIILYRFIDDFRNHGTNFGENEDRLLAQILYASCCGIITTDERVSLYDEILCVPAED